MVSFPNRRLCGFSDIYASKNNDGLLEVEEIGLWKYAARYVSILVFEYLTDVAIME